MVRMIEDCPKRQEAKWDTEQTRERHFSYDHDNPNDHKIMRLIGRLIDSLQPTCENCIHHYLDINMGYEAILCRINGNIENINNPHSDFDGSKCRDYKREQKGILIMDFPKFDEAFFDTLVHKAVTEKCEISIEITPENENITIRPWEPFQYNCPYRTE